MEYNEREIFFIYFDNTSNNDLYPKHVREKQYRKHNFRDTNFMLIYI